jgi:pimeloyl-ACP methyl ester carboxylesterase
LVCIVKNVNHRVNCKQILRDRHTMLTDAKLADPNRGGDVQKYSWHWQDCPLTITYEVLGQGQDLLLLPAMSTVSTREEVAGIAEALASQFTVTTLDWPGFGQSSRPALDYSPALYQQFLQDFVRDHFSQPVVAIAAGHAAGYVLQQARHHPTSWSQIVLIAPTWRGPLPTMGANPQLAGIVRQLVRSPGLGQFLYSLNTRPGFLRWMFQRHVYVDSSKLTSEFITHKYKITQQTGARFAPAAFVTGALDPVHSREEFLGLLRSLSLPVMAIIPEQAPPKSKAEMEILATLPHLQITRLPGTLGVHEEFATELVELVRPFLM